MTSERLIASGNSHKLALYLAGTQSTQQTFINIHSCDDHMIIILLMNHAHVIKWSLKKAYHRLMLSWTN